jgi:hypothetical protein
MGKLKQRTPALWLQQLLMVTMTMVIAQNQDEQ